MKKTNVIEKLLSSIINSGIIFIIAFPLGLYLKFNLYWKLLIIVLFLVLSSISLFNKGKRCLGMIVTKTYWKNNYSTRQHVIYNFLYTLSFSTLFFWFMFPFDLFLLNMFLIQLPTILLTKTTLHGFLSGNMVTVKK